VLKQTTAGGLSNQPIQEDIDCRVVRVLDRIAGTESSQLKGSKCSQDVRLVGVAVMMCLPKGIKTPCMGVSTAAGFCLVSGLQAEEQLLFTPPA
jgi:hypothetical protein